MSSRFPHSDEIAGVRVADKSRGGNEFYLRLEIWTKFKDEDTDVNREMREFIIKEYVEKFNLSTKVTFRNHKAY